MIKKISYGKQSINKNDINNVIKALKSELITQGPLINEFQKKLKNFVGAKYAVVSNSATSSLILACKAMMLNNKDIVWTSSNTFVSTANCVLHCGSKVNLIDIDLNTGNMCIEDLSKRLFEAKKKRKLPSIIIPVHFAGQPTEQEEIWKLSKKYHFKIIEDASHSLGASRNNIKVGNCKWSDIVISSFHPVKTITSGEGGVCFTNNKIFNDRILALRTHGIYKNNKSRNNTSEKQIWYFDQKLLGYNFRLTDIQSALGISQLARIKKFIAKRKKLSSNYDRFFSKNKNILNLKINKINKSSHHLYVIRIINKEKNFRNKLIKYLRQKGIYLNVHYIPVHYHSYFKKLKYLRKKLQNTEIYFDQAVSLPLYPDLKYEDQKYVVNYINKFLSK